MRVGEEVGEGRSEWCRQRDRAGGMYVCMPVGVEEEKPRVGRRQGEMTMTKIGVRVV